MSQLIKTNLFSLLVLALAICAVTPLKIVSLFGLVALGAFSLPLKYDYYFKLVLSFSIFFALNTLIAGIFFVCRIPLSASFMLVLYSGILLLLPKPKLSKINILELFEKAVVIKVIASAIIFIILMLPMVPDKNFTLFRRISFASDNVSHIELVKAVQSHKGYFQKPPNITKNTMTDGLAGYPQGLHANIYLAMETVQPLVNLSPYVRFVTFFYAYSLAMYIIFGALFGLLIKGMYPKSSRTIALAAGIGISVLFSGIFFSLLALGSQTQIASLVLFSAALVFLSQLYEKRPKDSHLYIYLAMIMLCGISFTWLFLLPVAGLIVAACFTEHFLVAALKRPLQHVKLILGILCLGALTMTQPIIQVLYSSPRKDGITEVGFSIRPSIYLTSILVISAGLFLVIGKIKASRLWLYALISSAGFSASIYIFQYIRVGDARYYFYKSLYAVFMISAVLIIVGLHEIFADKLRGHTKNKVILAGCLIITCAALGTGYNLNNPQDFYLKSHSGGFSKELAVTTSRLIVDDRSNGKKILSVGSCNRGYDYNLTRFVGVLTDEYDSYRQALVTAQLSPSKEVLLKAIQEYQKIRSPELIIVSSDISLQNYLQQKLNDNYGHETFVDLDFGHIPKPSGACPEMVH